MKIKKVFISNYYKNAHPIYKNLFNSNYIKPYIEYQAIKKTKYISFIINKIMNFINNKIWIFEFKKKSLILSLWTILNTEGNWCCFLEHYFILSDNKFKKLNSTKFKVKVQKQLEEKNCKKIFCLSNKTKEIIDKYFNSNIIREKTICIYPSLQQINNKNIKKPNKFTVLFIISNDFYAKWWREVMECYNIYFKNKKDIKFIIKSENIPNKYFIKWDNIEYITERISYSKILHLFQSSSLLLQPLYKSWYWVFLEAMSYWLPIITSQVFDLNEIVKNWKNWYTIDFWFSLYDDDFPNKFNSYKDFSNYIENNNIDKKAVQSMANKINILKSNNSIYEKISLRNIEETTKWRFSSKYRDKSILNEIKKISF